MSVRVEWYDIGHSAPVLRIRGQHWNPDADPEHVDDHDEALHPEDEVGSEVALVFAGDEVGVLAGTAEALRLWLDEADGQLRAYEEQGRTPPAP